MTCWEWKQSVNLRAITKRPELRRVGLVPIASDQAVLTTYLAIPAMPTDRVIDEDNFIYTGLQLRNGADVSRVAIFARLNTHVFIRVGPGADIS